MSKNYTASLDPANDPLTLSGNAVGEQIEATFGPEVPKDFTKANATLNALGSFVTGGKADDQAFIDDLNTRLSKYNIEFTGEKRVSLSFSLQRAFRRKQGENAAFSF